LSVVEPIRPFYIVRVFYFRRMKKYLIYILLLLIPIANKAVSDEPNSSSGVTTDIYSVLHLSEYGLSNEVFQLALKGQKKLESDGKLQNSNILTIIDFSQSSKNKRLYIVDLQNKALLQNTYVAHGRNTGEEYARDFSNNAGSHKSSLGFYLTEHAARGLNVGLSLILKGVEKGFNDNALKREIIMHGAGYATEEFIKKTGRLGRSFGCPSVPPDLIKRITDLIKDGTCLFIYQKDDNYLHNSTVLN
jgi:hypothetical protein